MVYPERRNIMQRKTNPWLIHLAKVRKENPNLSLTEAMKKAKVTYKKK